MNFRKTLLAAGMLAAVAVPFVAHAGLDLTVDINGDDQAHYDFNAGARKHHPMIWKAAQKLREAKHDLWKAANDFGGHKADAIGAINNALDQLAICEAK
jgi:hypothetical protein